MGRPKLRVGFFRDFGRKLKNRLKQYPRAPMKTIYKMLAEDYDRSIRQVKYYAQKARGKAELK